MKNIFVAASVFVAVGILGSCQNQDDTTIGSRLQDASGISDQGDPQGPAAIAAILDRIDGFEIWELDDSGEYTVESLAEVYRSSPLVDHIGVAHFEVSKYTANDNGSVFMIYGTYRDEEDGGNTYGWVETEAGVAIARIDDSFISRIDAVVEEQSFLSFDVNSKFKAWIQAAMRAEVERRCDIRQYTYWVYEEHAGQDFDDDGVEFEYYLAVMSMGVDWSFDAPFVSIIKHPVHGLQLDDLSCPSSR